jgi:uncharacterized protein
MINTLKNEMKQAMRDKNKEKLSTLRMLLATIETERSKAKLDSVEDFTEEQIIGFINRNIKALGQEIDSLVRADRSYTTQLLAIEHLKEYLPQQLTELEINIIVEDTISVSSSFGDVMKLLSSLKGKADMGLVSKIAKEKWNK